MNKLLLILITCASFVVQGQEIFSFDGSTISNGDVEYVVTGDHELAPGFTQSYMRYIESNWPARINFNHDNRDGFQVFRARFSGLGDARIINAYNPGTGGHFSVDLGQGWIGVSGGLNLSNDPDIYETTDLTSELRFRTRTYNVQTGTIFEAIKIRN